MTIYNDNFGNFYIGNGYGTTLVNWTEVLSCIRQALGSNDRANAYIGNTIRIDWRPNVTQETLNGIIDIPPLTDEFNLNGNFNKSTTRFGYHITRWGPAVGIQDESNIIRYFGGKQILYYFNDTICWVTASARNFNLFLFQNQNNYYFCSHGLLSNSNFNFPFNSYCFQTGSGPFGWSSGNDTLQCRGGTLVNNFLVQTTGLIANYSHINKNGIETQNEVELYLRSPNLNTAPLGYISNVFKWKVNGTETAPVIGDTVLLNMANATGDYAGQGTIFCKVVGRLGNTDESDLVGDYILMRVAS